MEPVAVGAAKPALMDLASIRADLAKPVDGTLASIRADLASIRDKPSVAVDVAEDDDGACSGRSGRNGRSARSGRSNEGLNPTAGAFDLELLASSIYGNEALPAIKHSYVCIIYLCISMGTS